VTDETELWEQRNSEYLRAALDWLWLRVEQVTPSPRAATIPARAGGWRRRPAAAPTVTAAPSTAEIDRAARAMAAAEAAAGDRPPALLILQQRLGMTVFERNVLLLAVAPQFNTGFTRLYDGRATFALAMTAFDDARWEAMAPHRPLLHYQLLTADDTDGMVVAPLRPAERVVNFVKGLDHLDARLADLLLPLDVEHLPEPSASQQPAVDQISRLAASQPDVVVNLIGADRPSKQLIAAAAARRLVAPSGEVGRRLMRLPARQLPADVHELAALGRLLSREQLLSPVVPYLDTGDLTADHPDTGVVDRLLTSIGGLLLLDSRDAWPWLPARGALVDVARPTPAEQRATWEHLTGDPLLAAATAAEFDLDLSLIHTVAAASVASGPDRGAVVRQDCRARCRPRLGLLAERLTPRADEGAIVLAPGVMEQLRLLQQQVQFHATVVDDWRMGEQSVRGLGITALFSGEPGVGKTLAAEVLAARLGLDLYRVDLSGVVSKYIGETEKNLRTVFDAADRGGSILFFDEADALFGKRSEVRDSHDRYANIEVSYLLTRMEMHRGLAILATNMRRGMDQAFSRRLRLWVDFPFPAEQERAAIWAGAFPPGARLSGVDHQRLARLSLAGGAIRNVAVNASFMAAAATPQLVTMPMVLAAARREYDKLGLSPSAADFHWEEPRLAATAPGVAS
jgi:hypothetical protein